MDLGFVFEIWNKMENRGSNSTRRDSVEIVKVVSQPEREKATIYVLEQEILNENINFLQQNEEIFKALNEEDKNDLLFSAFCLTNNPKIVKYLIEIIGADVGTLLHTELTFLQQREEVFKILDMKFKNQLILEACFHTDAERGKYLIEFLVENGANVNVKGIYDSNYTPLHAAALRGNFGIVKLLIKHRAKIDAKDKNERTPLHNTANMKIVEYLIEHNANIDQKDKYGNTPLMMSLIRWIPEISLFLIEKGAIVEGKSQNKENSTPLHLAVSNGNIEIVKKLIQHKAKLDPKNTKGQTAFDIAVEKKHEEIISILIEAESDAANAENKFGNEMKNINTNAKCIICFNPRNGIFTFNPCGHSVACEFCCKRIVYGSGDSKKCPYCRKPVSNYLKVFFQTMTPSPVVTAAKKARRSMIEKKCSNNEKNNIAINLAKSIDLLELSSPNDTNANATTATIDSTISTTSVTASAMVTPSTSISSTTRNQRELQNLNQSNIIKGKRTRTGR